MIIRDDSIMGYPCVYGKEFIEERIKGGGRWACLWSKIMHDVEVGRRID